jgi:hypothetical protein
MSARALANALPSLGVGQGEQLVRQTLRAHACFAQPYEGQWQVGHVARSPGADLDAPVVQPRVHASLPEINASGSVGRELL